MKFPTIIKWDNLHKTITLNCLISQLEKRKTINSFPMKMQNENYANKKK